MESKNFALVLGVLAVTTQLARAETPLASRSADDQYSALHGHGMVYAASAMDELGARVSQYGRFGYLEQCLGNGYEDNAPVQTLKWALCGDDVKALDMNAAREHFSDYEFGERLKKVERWKELGAKIETEAKTDKGIAQVLELAAKAKSEWKDYLAANQAAFDQFVKLHEALASGKTNEPAYQGCWEATQPAFAKAVKATKFAWEIESDPLTTRVEETLTSTENYIAAANFSMCAFSVHASGEAMAAAVLQARGGTVRIGWRTILIAKALSPAFKPKFADRKLNWTEHGMLFGLSDRGFLGDVGITSADAGTPKFAEITKVKKTGDDEVTLSFKADTRDACLQWVETNRISGFATNGDPMYQRVCKKRGKVDNTESDITISAKLAGG
ncbi:MAG TPA: hypothetical protein VMZ53_30915, partial [Kofleriaceae bacterium]|nr:hypothetical protein [Kofleriaceae bacterium]